MKINKVTYSYQRGMLVPAILQTIYNLVNFIIPFLFGMFAGYYSRHDGRSIFESIMWVGIFTIGFIASDITINIFHERSAIKKEKKKIEESLKKALGDDLDLQEVSEDKMKALSSEEKKES